MNWKDKNKQIWINLIYTFCVCHLYAIVSPKLEHKFVQRSNYSIMEPSKNVIRLRSHTKGWYITLCYGILQKSIGFPLIYVHTVQVQYMQWNQRGYTGSLYRGTNFKDNKGFEANWMQCQKKYMYICYTLASSCLYRLYSHTRPFWPERVFCQGK